MKMWILNLVMALMFILLSVGFGYYNIRWLEITCLVLALLQAPLIVIGLINKYEIVQKETLQK